MGVRGRWRRRSLAAELALAVVLLAAPLPAADEPAALEQRLAGATGEARVELLLQLAEAQMYRAPEKVVGYSQQALDGATAAGLPRQAARALLSRGTGYFQLGDLDRALPSYEQGLAAARGLGDELLIGGCLNGVAAVSLKRGQPDAALGFFTEAASHLEKTDDRARLAGVYNNISLIYYSRSEFDRALDFMFRALRFYEAAGDERGQGVVLNAIGNVYNRLADEVRAREHFERALAIAERTGHKQLLVGCLVNLGEILVRQREWDAALARFERALALARELGSREYVSVCLNNIGDVLRAQGKHEAALRYYLESMTIFEAMNARPRLAVSYVNIGRLSLQTGRLDEAEEYLLRGFATAREVEERSQQKDAAEALVELYRRRGDFRRAFEYQRAFEELKEQIFSKENYAKLTELQGRYETERKQAEIELLRKEREIQQLEARRQRLWLVLVATGLVLAAALAFVLYKRYQLKVRTNAELNSAYARMAELASHDQLTGLANRRSATERLELEIARAGRTGQPFSVVLVDVDDFKRINDEHGHARGDDVLRHLGRLLAAGVRAQDVAARWGGEEFLLVLPDTGRDGALVVAEKLREIVAASPAPCDDGAVRFTVTMGVASRARDGSLDELLRAADEALYDGKRAGKDRVVAAAP